MTDETVGHMHEKVVIPPADEIKVVERNWYTGPKEDYRPYQLRRQDGRADGQGRRRLPLPHHRPHPRRARLSGADARGRTRSSSRHLIEKIDDNADKIIRVEEDGLEGADVVVVSYGITSRIAIRAVQEARKEGIKVGSCGSSPSGRSARRRSANWPRKVKAFVVPELNYGQIVLEVERCAAGKCKVISVNSCGGAVHDPEEILAAIKEGAK